MAAWTSPASLPADRQAPGFGVINDILYLAGGAGSSAGSYTATSIKYDPSTGLWSNIASMPAARGWAGSGVIGGKLYVVCGTNTISDFKNGAVYDPATDSWTAIAPTATHFHDLPAAAVYNDKLYVFGGKDFPNLLTACEVYDPGANTWASIAAMPAARWQQGAATIGSYIYVVGGSTDTTYGAEGLGDVATLYRYDPAGDSWSTLTSMGTARCGPAVAAMNGLLYVAGGRDSTSFGTTTFEVYDPATDSWASLAAMPAAARGNAGVGVIASQYMHVSGGYTGGSGDTSHSRYAIDLRHWWVGSVHA